MPETKVLVKANSLYAGGTVILGTVIKESRQMVTYREASTGEVRRINKFSHKVWVETLAPVVAFPNK